MSVLENVVWTGKNAVVSLLVSSSEEVVSLINSVALSNIVLGALEALVAVVFSL